jgi:S1-C subfamily serine protease
LGDVREATARLTKSFEVVKGIATHQQPFVHGLRVDFTSVLAQRFGARRGRIPDGVVISEIKPNSPATVAKLLDWRILAVNGDRVHKPADFYAAVTLADKKGQAIQLTVVGPDRSAEEHDIKLP